MAYHEARLEQATVEELDLSQARNQKIQMERMCIDAENTYAKAKIGLLNRLNLALTANVVPAENRPTQRPLVDSATSAEALLEFAGRNHPVLKRQAEEQKALEYEYKTIRSTLIPSVTLRSNLSGNGADWDTMNYNFTKGIALDINLLENMGVAIPYRLQEKKLEIERKVFALEAARRNIESQVMNAYIDVNTFSESVTKAEEEDRLADENYRIALENYQAGKGIYLNVLNAQTSRINAHNNLIRATINYNRSQVRLLEAIGQVSPETLLTGIKT